MKIVILKIIEKNTYFPMLMTVLKVFIYFYDVFSDNRFFEEEWVKKDTWIFLYKLKNSNFLFSNVHCFTDVRVQN